MVKQILFVVLIIMAVVAPIFLVASTFMWRDIHSINNELDKLSNTVDKHKFIMTYNLNRTSEPSTICTLIRNLHDFKVAGGQYQQASFGPISLADQVKLVTELESAFEVINVLGILNAKSDSNFQYSTFDRDSIQVVTNKLENISSLTKQISKKCKKNSSGE